MRLKDVCGALGLLLITVLGGCSSLFLDEEADCSTHVLWVCGHTYLSNSVSGRVVGDEGRLGIFGLASVSMREHGKIKLAFYRLRDSSEEYVVKKVQLGRSETMTTGRSVHFSPAGVSEILEGDFDYSSYFPYISADVFVASSAHTYRCEVILAYSRAPTMIKARDIEPKIPTSVVAFEHLPPPTTNPNPSFRRESTGCTEVLQPGKGP